MEASTQAVRRGFLLERGSHGEALTALTAACRGSGLKEGGEYKTKLTAV